MTGRRGFLAALFGLPLVARVAAALRPELKAPSGDVLLDDGVVDPGWYSGYDKLPVSSADIIASVIERRSRRIADNVSSHNVLLRHLGELKRRHRLQPQRYLDAMEPLPLARRAERRRVFADRLLEQLRRPRGFSQWGDQLCPV